VTNVPCVDDEFCINVRIAVLDKHLSLSSTLKRARGNTQQQYDGVSIVLYGPSARKASWISGISGISD
jgi:hypothetical protein